MKRRGLIVAVSPEGVIGVDNRIPWHYPADLKRFKRLTLNTTVIMGRRTYESIGKPLPERRNIVITQTEIPGVECFTHVASALAAASGPVWFIGGAGIFAEAMPLCDTIDVTYVPDSVRAEGAVTMPPVDERLFEAGPLTLHEDDPRLSHRVYARRPEAPPPLVLASTSRYRRALLERVGLAFCAAPPPVGEEVSDDVHPLDAAPLLAVRKAESLPIAGALIIGSDQIVELGGERLGKPLTIEAAEAQLRKLRGRAHRLITAVAVHAPDKKHTDVAVDVHTLTMRDLSDAQIARYVAADAPLDCAGAYKLERRGLALFEHAEADPEIADDTAVVGLPMMKLLRLLRRYRVDPLGL